MPNLASILKSEIARLARRESRALTRVSRKAAAQHRRDIAALKRQVAALEREVSFLKRQEQRRITSVPDGAPLADGSRFSPNWVLKHRKKLGLSAADYGQLIGVTGLTVYNWEGGKSRPRTRQLSQWAAVRGLRKREAMKRLELVAN
jgi:DNA-binding transcriptional regulator YiaG